MIENIKLHWQYIKMRIAARTAYRVDFIISAFAFFLFQLVAPAFVGVIYYAGGEFPGWTFAQVLLMQGALNLVKGFSFMLFFGILWNTISRVRHGTFDLFLTRPINTLWLLIMESFDEEDVGQVLGGITVTAAALYLLKGVHGSALMFAIFIIFGILFFFSLALLCSAATIRLIRTHRLYEFVDIIMVFAGYPKTVYSKSLGIVFSVIFPLFVASYYPASALLGFSYEYGIAAMFSTLLLVALSLFIWHRALQKYQSAGG